MANDGAITVPASRYLSLILALLIVVGIAGSWALGLFGPVQWKAIDLARLGAEFLLMAMAVAVFNRLTPHRPKVPVAVLVVVAQMPLAMNTTNPVVQTAAAALAVLAVLLMVMEVFRRRSAGKEAAG